MLYVLIIHDGDWQWNGEDSVFVESERCGGVFSTKELAEQSTKNEHDILEVEVDKPL